MKRQWICSGLLWLSACGGAMSGREPRIETKAQFQQRAAACEAREDAASCRAAPDDACHWQDAACALSDPPQCFPARCLPDVTECRIVSSDGQEMPCSEVADSPMQQDPSPGSGG